jgi:nucleoside-diphosphate-sugar epimerase
MTTTTAPAGTTPQTEVEGLSVVTGAFSYSGRAIARRLLAAGLPVRTLTGHPARGAEDSRIDTRPLDFGDVAGLVDNRRGATTLFNTYWVRFGRDRLTHDVSVSNSRLLFQAARRAGVERIVHVSITHPSIDSPYPYFSGKAEVERALAETGVPYTILRPAILFGEGGVLLNNIAWLLRRLPLFVVGGRGDYAVRGIHVDDLAALAIAHASGGQDVIVDAVGPDRPTFLALVDAIRAAVGSRALILPAPGAVIPVLSSLLNVVVRDVLLTRDEYAAMADGLADSDAPTTGPTSVLEWIAAHGDSLGQHYANELDRHFR